MTIDVSNNNPRAEYYLAAGTSQAAFAVPFDFFEDADVTVYVDDSLKVLGSDYTLSGGDGSTGTVTFLSSVSGPAYVVVARHVSLERVTDFVAGQDINRAALNTQLDTIVAQIADLDDKVDRTLHITDYEVNPGTALPSIDARKGRVIAFNSTTGAIEAGPTSNDIATIATNISVILQASTNADNAAASASAAASSATAAASSESSSSADASAAAASAATASTAAATSTTQASAAAASAASASSSAASASTSATNAASSATVAQAAQTGAEAAYDSFDDRYLGAKASAPATDNDGDPLLTGALYYNTTASQLYIWNGSAWDNAAFSASGSVTSFNTRVGSVTLNSTDVANAFGMLTTNNLSDLGDAATARTNLGLGTAATTASTDYAAASHTHTLSQITDAGTAAASATTDFATAAQGALADSATQPGDNISTLTNDSGFTTNTGTVTSVAATAGTGISISGSPITSSGTLTITNTAPDQTVSLTAGSNITITGSYPSFTIAASSGGSTTVGDVGTYAALFATTNASRNQGDTLAGSSLRYSNFYAYGSVGYNATSPSGTWQCMGNTGYDNGSALNQTDKQSTIWLRIS